MANPNKIKNGGSGTKVGNFIRNITGSAKPAVIAPPLKKPISVVTSNPAKKIVANINSTINKTSGLNDNLANFDRGYSEYEDTISNLDNGRLSKSEKAMLKTARAGMASEIEAQKLANRKFEAGTEQMGIRSGRQRYASEVQSGIQKGAVDQGIAKVNQLNVEMESKLAEIEQDILDKNYKKARDKYNEYNDYLKERRSIIKDIASASAGSKAAKTADSLKAYDAYKTAGGNLGYSDWAITANDSADLASNPVTITPEYAQEIGLPTSLIGTTTAELINSLASDNVPSWFNEAFAENALNFDIQPGMEQQALAQAWNQFRKDPRVLASAPQATETVTTTTNSGSYTTLPTI